MLFSVIAHGGNCLTPDSPPSSSLNTTSTTPLLFSYPYCCAPSPTPFPSPPVPVSFTCNYLYNPMLTDIPRPPFCSHLLPGDTGDQLAGQVCVCEGRGGRVLVVLLFSVVLISNVAIVEV